MNYFEKRLLHGLTIGLFLILLITSNASAQLEIGGHMQIRNIKPGFGYGFNAEIGIPTDSDWRLAFRGYMSFFGEGVPEYSDEVKWNPKTEQYETYVNGKTGSPAKGFDRGLGIRIYYQTSEFQPYFGFGATYMFNDIISPLETPTIDFLERSLNYDFTLGFSYLFGDNLNFFSEFHYAKITRMTEFVYTRSLGVNIGITFRFGRNKFAEYYEY